MMTRPDNRAADEMRKIEFQPNIAPHADGSTLVCFGNTQVICSVMVEEKVPRWMKNKNVREGWITAEYSMLPYATLERKKRATFKPDSRSLEIQRLIGRSLRQAVNLEILGERTLWVDCDVLQADGGTRTASITGGYVALALACEKLMREKKLVSCPLRKQICAISAGIYYSTPILDLNYLEDSNAEVDLNLVMTENEEYVEIQGTGEESSFSSEELDALLKLGKGAVSSLCKAQNQAIQEGK